MISHLPAPELIKSVGVLEQYPDYDEWDEDDEDFLGDEC